MIYINALRIKAYRGFDQPFCPLSQKFNILKVEEQEAYATNCIWINDHVIIPYDYPHAKNIIENEGYKIIEVDVSEFRKLDGGLSCLSLRF